MRNTLRNRWKVNLHGATHPSRYGSWAAATEIRGPYTLRAKPGACSDRDIFTLSARASGVTSAPTFNHSKRIQQHCSAALPGRSRGSTGATRSQRSSAPSSQPYRCRAERRQPASAVPRAWKHAWKGTQYSCEGLCDGRMGGLAGGSGCQLQVTTMVRKGISLSGLESAAQSETETRNEAKQRDDQGDRYGAHFAIRDTLTLVQR